MTWLAEELAFIVIRKVHRMCCLKILKNRQCCNTGNYHVICCCWKYFHFLMWWCNDSCFAEDLPIFLAVWCWIISRCCNLGLSATKLFRRKKWEAFFRQSIFVVCNMMCWYMAVCSWCSVTVVCYKVLALARLMSTCLQWMWRQWQMCTRCEILRIYHRCGMTEFRVLWCFLAGTTCNS